MENAMPCAKCLCDDCTNYLETSESRCGLLLAKYNFAKSNKKFETLTMHEVLQACEHNKYIMCSPQDLQRYEQSEPYRMAEGYTAVINKHNNEELRLSFLYVGGGSVKWNMGIVVTADELVKTQLPYAPCFLVQRK